MNLWRRKKVQVSSSFIDIFKDNQNVINDLKRRIRMRPKGKALTEEDYLLFLAKMNSFFAETYIDFFNSRGQPEYRASSLFLKDSYQYLNKGADESLHFVTGLEVDGKKILNRMIELNLEDHNPCFAKADSDSVKKALIYLSIHGFRLLGCFHIHPGSGPGATYPSSTDLKLDRLLFRGGYESVGAIFSRDGYVRFYSLQDFNIRIYGKGVERVDEYIYRIVEVS